MPMDTKSKKSSLPEPTEAPSSATTGVASGEFYHGVSCQPEETVGYMIRILHLSLLKRIDLEMQGHDLTAMQWRPLLIISKGKGDTAALLAKEMGMDTGAITRMLDRLQSKGLVIRKRSELDRRVVHLELTEEGHRICAQIPFGLCKAINHHLQGFSPVEFDVLKDFLKRMILNGGTP